MLRAHLKIAFRSLLRNKGYTLITVSGLAVGIAVCLLIGLFILDELAFDSFQVNGSRIYRLHKQVKVNGSEQTWNYVSAPIGRALVREFPEVESAVSTLPLRKVVSLKAAQFAEQQILFADSNFLSVFTFPLLKGNPKTALLDAGSVILTRKTAAKYFGTQDPVGQTLTIDNKHLLTVTGVMEDIPDNSSLQFELLANFRLLYEDFLWLDDWGSGSCQTYLLFRPGSTPADIAGSMYAFIEKYAGTEVAKVTAHPMFPFMDLHLKSNTYRGGNEGSIELLYLFACIGTFILLLACINYMNLATARSTKRMKEVGVKKVMGSFRSQLIGQFLTEAWLAAGLSLLLGVALAYLALPALNHFLNRSIPFILLDQPLYVAALVGITLLVGAVAGAYPAFYLSRFPAATVLKGTFRGPASAFSLRKVLVVGQFLVSVTLIVAAITVYKQLHFMRTKDLGFRRENIMTITLRDDQLNNRLSTLKNEINKIAGVMGTSVSITGINEIGWRSELQAGAANGEPQRVFAAHLVSDADFTKVMGIQLAAGRHFTTRNATDTNAVCLVNEALVKKLGWEPEQAIGRRVTSSGFGRQAEIIGVTKDFNISSLHRDIEPLIVVCRANPLFNGGGAGKLNIHFTGDQDRRLVAACESIWKKIVPEWPFEYQMQSEDLEKMYRQEQKAGELFTVFAALAVFIGCLGLFGLTAHTAEIRTKEIGIRKVLGASVGSIVTLLSKEFIGLIGIANLIAWPLAYFAMRNWLEDFAYRITIDWWVFALAGFISLLITLLTVSFQSIKAALANPVQSLHSE